MLSVQIVSDLHIECNDDVNINPLDYITPSAPVLIMAGDIGSIYKTEQLQTFLNNVCKYFEAVVYIPGNHEYYMIDNINKLDYKSLENKLGELGESIPNLFILNRKSILIGNICIAGCTLWSKPEGIVPKFIVRIFGINTDKYMDNHKVDLNYIKSMINYCKSKKYKLVMVTHHPPTYKVFSTPKNKRFPYLYATELDYLLDKDKIHTWICGHTHKNFNFLSENNCKILSNQKGKIKDKVFDFSKSSTITF